MGRGRGAGEPRGSRNRNGNEPPPPATECDSPSSTPRTPDARAGVGAAQHSGESAQVLPRPWEAFQEATQKPRARPREFLRGCSHSAYRGGPAHPTASCGLHPATAPAVARGGCRPVEVARPGRISRSSCVVGCLGCKGGENDSGGRANSTPAPPTMRVRQVAEGVWYRIGTAARAEAMRHTTERKAITKKVARKVEAGEPTAARGNIAGLLVEDRDRLQGEAAELRRVHPEERTEAQRKRLEVLTRGSGEVERVRIAIRGLLNPGLRNWPATPTNGARTSRARTAGSRPLPGTLRGLPTATRAGSPGAPTATASLPPSAWGAQTRRAQRSEENGPEARTKPAAGTGTERRWAWGRPAPVVSPCRRLAGAVWQAARWSGRPGLSHRELAPISPPG